MNEGMNDRDFIEIFSILFLNESYNILLYRQLSIEDSGYNS